MLFVRFGPTRILKSILQGPSQSVVGQDFARRGSLRPPQAARFSVYDPPVGGGLLLRNSYQASSELCDLDLRQKIAIKPPPPLPESSTGGIDHPLQTKTCKDPFEGFHKDLLRIC